jgi:uncharacterized protein with HEPN domain
LAPRKARQRLEDILRSIDKINAFTARGFPDISQEDPVWDSIVHNITIIGEAIKSLPPSVRELSTAVEWSDIVRMRDFVVHRYFEIEHLVLRNTVEEDLPRLRAAIESVLPKIGPDEMGEAR